MTIFKERKQASDEFDNITEMNALKSKMAEKK